MSGNPHQELLNINGRLVGIYTDPARDVQRIFFFDGAAVSVFGSFPANAIIRVGLNDEGAMLVSDDSLGEGAAQTWRVLSGGEGC